MPVITCGDKEFVVPYDDNLSSEYIKDIVKLSNNTNVIIPIPDKYCSVIGIYIKFLGDSEIPAISSNQILLSFQLCTLFADDHYFKYCVQQVFNNWTDTCVMVYNDFNDDLQWSFFLQSPYNFIPKYLLNSNLFMVRWKKLNQNVIINVNQNNAIYYNNVESVDSDNKRVIRTHHTIHGKEVGYAKVTGYYPGSNNIDFEGYYIDGKADGLWRKWHNNNQNTLKSEGYFVNGKADGLWREWHDNPQHMLFYEGHYVDGKKDGLWTVWYNNDQHTLRSEGHYVDGKHSGHWIELGRNGTVVFDGEYINGVKQQ